MRIFFYFFLSLVVRIVVLLMIRSLSRVALVFLLSTGTLTLHGCGKSKKNNNKPDDSNDDESSGAAETEVSTEDEKNEMPSADNLVLGPSNVLSATAATVTGGPKDVQSVINKPDQQDVPPGAPQGVADDVHKNLRGQPEDNTSSRVEDSPHSAFSGHVKAESSTQDPSILKTETLSSSSLPKNVVNDKKSPTGKSGAPVPAPEEASPSGLGSKDKKEPPPVDEPIPLIPPELLSLAGFEQRFFKLPPGSVPESAIFVNVVADGNCLFRAVSVFISPDHDEYAKHAELRAEIIQKGFLRNVILSQISRMYSGSAEENWTMYSQSNPDENLPDTIEAYLQLMSRDGQWAGHWEIFAVAELLKRRIRLIIQGQDQPTFHPSTPYPGQTEPDITLLYKSESRNQHYMSYYVLE